MEVSYMLLIILWSISRQFKNSETSPDLQGGTQDLTAQGTYSRQIY